MIGAMEDLMNQGYTEDEATELYFRQVYGNPPDSMSPPVRRVTPVPTVVAPRQASPAPRQAAGTMYAPNGQAVAYAGIGNGYNVAPVLGGYSPYPTTIMLPPVQSGYSLLADIVQRVPTYNYGPYFDSIVRQGARTPRRRTTNTAKKPAPPTNPNTPANPTTPATEEKFPLADEIASYQPPRYGVPREPAYAEYGSFPNRWLIEEPEALKRWRWSLLPL